MLVFSRKLFMTKRFKSSLVVPFAVLGLSYLPLHSQAEESTGHAQRIVIEVLKEQAQRLPEHADHLNELALGLHAGSVTLAEAEQVVRIIQLLQPAKGGQAPALPSSQSDGSVTSAAAVTNPQDILGALDAPDPVSTNVAQVNQAQPEPEALPTTIEELEQWAGTDSPNLEPEVVEEVNEPEVLRQPAEGATAVLTPAPAAPKESLVTAAPDLSSDQADLPDLDARVRLVQQKAVGEQQLNMVFVDRGSDHGLEKGQRLRAERNGEIVVLLSVFNVRPDMAVAVVLDGTWGKNSGREVRQGDQVVRDR